jgi:hypothetical protein
MLHRVIGPAIARVRTPWWFTSLNLTIPLCYLASAAILAFDRVRQFSLANETSVADIGYRLYKIKAIGNQSNRQRTSRNISNKPTASLSVPWIPWWHGKQRTEKSKYLAYYTTYLR